MRLRLDDCHDSDRHIVCVGRLRWPQWQHGLPRGHDAPGCRLSDQLRRPIRRVRCLHDADPHRLSDGHRSRHEAGDENRHERRSPHDDEKPFEQICYKPVTETVNKQSPQP